MYSFYVHVAFRPKAHASMCTCTGSAMREIDLAFQLTWYQSTGHLHRSPSLPHLIAAGAAGEPPTAGRRGVQVGLVCSRHLPLRRQQHEPRSDSALLLYPVAPAARIQVGLLLRLLPSAVWLQGQVVPLHHPPAPRVFAAAAALLCVSGCSAATRLCCGCC